MMNGRVLTVQVGMPRRMGVAGAGDAQKEEWESGIFKGLAAGKVWVGKGGMAGDGQADLVFHGGPDNVVLAYAAEHYEVWRRELGLPGLEFGGFGENLTVEGFRDETVCVGDVWCVGGKEEGIAGGVMLQVTQPRQPCWKLALRLGRPEAVKRTKERGWGGWYMRVLREGFVEGGMGIELVERRHGEWPVARAVQVMYGRKREPEQARTLAGVAELSVRWKQELLE